jgi:outer membrane murein-binding lipoprotein Lpp
MSNQDYSFSQWNKRTGAYLGAIALGISTLLLPGCTNISRKEELSPAKVNVTANDVSSLSGDAVNSICKKI